MRQVLVYLIPMSLLILLQQLLPSFLPSSRGWRQPVDIFFKGNKETIELPEKPVATIPGKRKFGLLMIGLWLGLGVLFALVLENTPFYFYLPIGMAIVVNLVNATRRIVVYENAIGIKTLTKNRLFFVKDLYSLSSQMVKGQGPVYVLYLTKKQPAAVLLPKDYEEIFRLEDYFTPENPSVKEVRKDQTWQAE